MFNTSLFGCSMSYLEEVYKMSYQLLPRDTGYGVASRTALEHRSAPAACGCVARLRRSAYTWRHQNFYCVNLVASHAV